MDYSAFRKKVRTSPKPFFKAWEQALKNWDKAQIARKPTKRLSQEWSSFIPFLRLLRTEAILNWAKEFLSDNKESGRWAAAVMPTLLERHVLPVAHRLKPDLIGDFWRWAVPYSSEFALDQLWEDLDLPATLDPELIVEQEERFAQALKQATEKVTQKIGPDHWAVKTLQDLARRRGRLGREFAKNAQAHVVFGFDQPPDALRSGLIVPFRLLKQAKDDEFDVHPNHVFADDFRDALREHVRGRVRSDDLRSLEHDWDFLGEKSLTGTSGTMAIWLAQFLAAGGSRDQHWTLPPWVLVTATLNRQGHGTGGAAGTVGLLRSKVEIALEEGVRVLVVASKTGSTDDITRELGDLPGFANLELVGVRAGEDDVADIARALRERQLCWPVELDAVPGDLHAPTSVEEQYLIEERFAIYERRLREQSEEYVPPKKVLQRIEAARQELPGCGYIHIIAPPMWGKSQLILAQKHGWKRSQESVALGHTLGYAILHGRPENPPDFLFDIFVQAKQQAGERAFSQFKPPNQHQTDKDTRRAVSDMLEIAHRSLHGRPLMLAVDALDEITTDSNRSLILDCLPRADELPLGCYILLTSRPQLRPRVWKSLADRIGSAIPETGVTSASEVFTDFEGLDPTPFYRPIKFEIDDDHRQLLREFLLDSFGEPIQRHLDAILEHGQERFLYVRLLRDLLLLQMKERGDAVLRDLKPGELPQADDVFPAYLDSLTRTVDSHAAKVAGSLREPNAAHGVSGLPSNSSLFNTWHRPILLLIAAAYEPITHDHLRCWLGIRDWKDDRENHPLNLVLDELAPLLLIDRPPELPNTSRFTLAHRELVDWLQNNQHPQWEHAIRDEAHRGIAEVADRQPLPNTVAALSPIDLYHFLHAPSHWLDVGDDAAAWRRLANVEERDLLDDLTIIYYERWLWRREIGVWDRRIAQFELLVATGQISATPSAVFQTQTHYLAMAYGNRGVARRRQQDFVGSETDSNRAIKLLKSLLTMFGGAESAVTTQSGRVLVHHLARAYVNRGSARDDQQQFVRGMADYNRAIKLLESLLTMIRGAELAVSTKPQPVDTLAGAYQNRGSARLGQHDLVGAVTDYDRAIELIEKLLSAFGGAESAVTTQPSLVSDLARVYMNRGSARKAQQKFVGAMTDYNRAIKLRKSLLTTIRGAELVATTKPEFISDLATTYMNRGNGREAQQDFVGAEKDYERAIKLLGSLLTTFGGAESAVTAQPDLVDDLASVYMNRGNVRRDQQKVIGAVRDYNRAIKLLESLLTMYRGAESAVLTQPRFVNTLALAYQNRGYARHEQQEFVRAVTDYNRAIKLLESLLTTFGGAESAVTTQPRFVNYLAKAYLNRGCTRQRQQNFVGAVSDYDRAIGLLARLLDVMRQFAVGIYFWAINCRVRLHIALNDDSGLGVTVVKAVTTVVDLYRQIGVAIRLPDDQSEFDRLAQIVSNISPTVAIDDSVRTAWDELRVLFAQA